MYFNGSTSETTIFVGGILEKHTAGGVTEFRHTISAGEQPVALYTRPDSGTITTQYFLLDHLGSVAEITNSLGALEVPENFAAFGERRDASDWSGPPSAGDVTLINGATQRGYTFHTNSESSSLIHMNGRMADSLTGRFLSADPFVFQPMLTQSFNRYSYVRNNPLTYTDPSGFGPCRNDRGVRVCIRAGLSLIFGRHHSRRGGPSPPPPKAASATGRYGKAVATRLFNMASDIYGLPRLRSSSIWGAGDGQFGSGACRWGAGCLSWGDELGRQTDQPLSEREILETMIEHARNGILGFEIPEGWTFTYSDQMIACGKSLSGLGCGFRQEISDPNNPDRVYALTNPSKLTTEFYRGAASRGVYDRFYEDPYRPNQPVVLPPTELDAYERAAWTIGHEIDGHINYQLPAGILGELKSEYYGRRALQAWREYLRGSNDGK